MRRRVPIPPPYDNPPRFSACFAIFIEAFNALSEEREPIANGLSYIKLRAIREWAEYHDFAHDRDFMQELVAYIKALDSVWVPIKFKEMTTKGSLKDGRAT